jgi:chromosome partitioning protein
METVIILSRKGGVGKTATAHALGAALMKRKKRVLFIDADGQCNLTLTMKADEEQSNLYDVLSKESTLKSAIQETEGGYIIPGNEMLHAADITLKGSDKNLILREALKEVSKQFDYCIIDTPAALGVVTMNCLIAADKIIVPVRADIYSLQGISRMVDALETVKKNCGSKAKISGFLVTMCNPRTRISKQMIEGLENIAKRLNTRVYKSIIRNCTALPEAALQQTDIYSYDPGSNAAADYKAFVEEFIKQK